MHDYDRTMGRTNMESFEFQAEEEMNEFEFEGEQELISEEEVNELATELMSATNEQELEQFLDGLVNRVGDAVRKVGSKAVDFARSPAGQQIGHTLRTVARTALPLIAEKVVDRYAPGFGPLAGGAVEGIGQAMGLELEGLSHEDRDFEVAKQFVRLAADAAQTAAHAPPHEDPVLVAKHAMTEAARQYAPGLLASVPTANPHGSSAGRWFRDGSRIVLEGA
jgi:hypothetical protein